MLRTIDSTIPSNDEIKSFTKEEIKSKLPLPFQTLPKSCQAIPQTALNEIQTIIKNINEIGIDVDVDVDVDTAVSNASLSSLEEDALDDGFILCDLNVVQRKLVAWYKMFPRVKPFFALKCNPDVMVAHVLGLNPDCGFDCASISEIRLALSSSNGDSRRCVYANPQRARDDLDASLKLGTGALTFDGSEELHKVKDAHERLLKQQQQQQQQQRVESATATATALGEDDSDSSSSLSNNMALPPQMILRILVPDDQSTVPLGEKFGAPPDRVQALTEEALELGFDVIGVSFHCGSGCHDAEAFGNAIKIAKVAIDDINIVIARRNELDGKDRQECRLLDIGGGYPGVDAIGADTHRFSSTTCTITSTAHAINDEQQDSVSTAYQVSTVVTPLIDNLFPADKSPIQVISEPGRYFVEAAFIYCARIYSVKAEDEDKKRHYYISQGVHGLFKDVLLCDESFTPIPLMINYDEGDAGAGVGAGAFLDTTRPNEAVFDSIVHGPSGEDFDVVCKACKLPKLTIGDWLIFDRMGAYTLSIAARNSSLPVRYVFGGGGGT